MKKISAIIKCMVYELFRKKDFYVLFIFMLVLLSFLAVQDFYGVEGINRYIRDVGYTITILFSFIVAVTFTARQIPLEIESKTIYPLLAKPVTRGMFIVGKFLGGFLISSFSFLLYYLIYTFFCAKHFIHSDVVLFSQGFAFGIMFLAVSNAIVVFFSIVLTTSANITITFLLYFFMANFGDYFKGLVLGAKGVKAVAMNLLYYFLPHFDFYDFRVRLAHRWDPVSVIMFSEVALYTVLYCILMLWCANMLFKRRSL